jgi:hypothetical protein
MRWRQVTVNPILGVQSFPVALNARGMRALNSRICTGDAIRSYQFIVGIHRSLRTVFIVEIATKQAPNDKGNIEYRDGCGKVGEVI